MFESTVVCGRIALGIQGEHHARKVSFAETGIWKEKFGEGRFELLHKRNGDVAPYPINMTIENDVPYWYVTASDTAVAGVGKCELRYIVNDVVIKSCTFITDVDASLGEGTEAPDPYKAWVDEVLGAAEDVKTATVHQPIIGENGNWFVYDFETSAYVDTGVSASGGVDVDLSDYVKNTDYATQDKSGVIKTSSYFGALTNADGYLYLMQATDAEIDAKEQKYHLITPKNLEYAVKSVGDGYYITDTDYATGSKGGVGKISTNFGILVNPNGYFYPMVASEEEIDAGTHKYHIIAPSNLKYAVAKGGEGHFAKEDAVFETGSFGWTDFDYTLPTDDFGSYGEVSANSINVGGTGDSVIIHCAGKTLGFTFSVWGWSDANLKINGITTTYTNSAYDGSEFATNIVIPPTYMESDIEFSGGMNTWNFTDMTIQSIKGFSELESQIGDIDMALDSILAMQNELIGGDV